MNIRTTLVMLVVLLAVGAAWWVTRSLPDNPSHTAPHGDESKPVFAADTLAPHRIERFEIAQPGKPTVVLEHHRGRWTMTAPMRFEADTKTVDQIITTLAALLDKGPAAQAIDADHPPIAVLTFVGKNETRTLRLGQRLGGGIAPVQYNDHPPRLVADILHGFFERYDPTDLLSKQLATPSAYRTDRITITTPQATTHLERNDDRWFIDGDPQQPALNEPVPGFVDVAGYLNIPNATPLERFILQPADDLSPYGLNRPRVRIDYQTPSTNGVANSTLLIGAPTDASATSYFATYYNEGDPKPVVFVLPAEFSIVMAKSADDFRDPRLFTIAPQDIERIELEGQWTLAMRDERGSIIDAKRTLDRAMRELSEHIEMITQARAIGYGRPREDTPASTEPHPLTLSLFSIADDPPEVVRIYGPGQFALHTGESDNRSSLAIREGERVGLILSQEVVMALQDLGRFALPLESLPRE